MPKTPKSRTSGGPRLPESLSASISSSKNGSRTSGASRGGSQSRNSTGYAMRQSRKNKLAGGDLHDVYEYKQEDARKGSGLKKGRVQGFRLDAGTSSSRHHGNSAFDDFGPGQDTDGGDSDEDDAGPGGSGVNGKPRPRLIGENKDDEMIDSDDDEEIDSDAAFEEEDDEHWGGVFNRHKQGYSKQTKSRAKTAPSAKRTAEVNLDENDSADSALDDGVDEGTDDSEEEEDGDPADFLDVLDMLDGRGPVGSDDDEPANPPASKTKAAISAPATAKSSRGPGIGMNIQSDDEDSGFDKPEDDDDDSEYGSDEDDDESMHDISASEDEADGEEGTAALAQFISGLPANTKRKASDESEEQQGAEGDSAPRKKRVRILKDRTEAGVEGEFRAVGADGPKLSLADLLAPLQPTASAALKKSAKSLQGGSASSGALPAPAPQRMKEKLDREAAYEKTKEDVSKWGETIKRIKEAERLQFPLQQESEGKVSNLELAAKFKPSTNLESSISRLLVAASLQDHASTQRSEEEALQSQQLTMEEVAERRAELRKMRELMFRAETKAKRVKKIKSKTYRKLQRKAKDKVSGDAEEDDDDEDDEERRLKREVERARERATLRHKNTGKWAKAMKKKGEVTGEERAEMEEMLERGEKLRQRIQGVGSDDDDSNDGSDDDDGDDDEEAIRNKAFSELAQLDDAGDDDLQPEGKKGKNVFEMKFMKDAMARQMQAVDRDRDDFAREMQLHEDGDAHTDDAAHSGSVSIQRVGGRATYRPGISAVTTDLHRPAPAPSDTSSVTLRSTDFPPSPATSTIVSPFPHGHAATSSSSPAVAISSSSLSNHDLRSQSQANPWLTRLTAEETEAGSKQRKSEVLVSKGSKTADKAKHKLDKKTGGKGKGKAGAEDNAVHVDLDDVMVLDSAFQQEGTKAGPTAKKSTGKNKEKSQAPEIAEADDSDEVHSELEEQERQVDATLKGKAKENKKGLKAFEQRDLVARAFAGDNVVQDFEQAKRREIAEDAPKEVDTTLQGWGAWGGQGTKRVAPKPHLVKKVAGVDPKSRADYGKSHIIVSEKRDKKASKYQLKDLPYPYTSRAQYERSMEVPMGAEWNSRKGVQRNTMPRVIVKAGAVIEPVTKLS